MAKKEEHSERLYSSPQRDRLSESELYGLDQELRAFMVEKEITWPMGGDDKEKVTICDRNAWMESRGAMQNGRVVISGFKPAKYSFQGNLLEPSDCEPIIFEQCDEDYRQWLKWKGRKEYAENKNLEHYDEEAKKLAHKFTEI